MSHREEITAKLELDLEARRDWKVRALDEWHQQCREYLEMLHKEYPHVMEAIGINASFCVGDREIELRARKEIPGSQGDTAYNLSFNGKLLEFLEKTLRNPTKIPMILATGELPKAVKNDAYQILPFLVDFLKGGDTP